MRQRVSRSIIASRKVKPQKNEVRTKRAAVPPWQPELYQLVEPLREFDQSQRRFRGPLR